MAQVNSPGTTGYRWRVLLLLSSLNACTTGVFFVTSPLAPFLQADLGITRAQVGLLMSAILVGAAVMSTPGSWLADRSIRWNLLFFQCLAAGSLLFFSRAATLEQALIGALGMGMGAGTVLAIMIKAVATWFHVRERATAMGLFFAGASIGSASGAVLLPPLSLTMGWRQALLIMAIVILALGVTVFALYRDIRSASGSGSIAKTPGEVAGLSYWNLSVLWIIGIVMAAPQYALAAYIVLYLKETLNFSVVEAGIFLAMVQGSSLFGRIGWGVVSDRLLRGNRKAVLLIAGGMFTISLSVVAGGLSAYTALLVLMFLIGVSGFSWYGIWMSLLAECSETASATVLGIGQTLCLVGVIVGPPLFGLLVDSSNSYAPAWTASAIAAGISTMLVVLVREGRSPVPSFVRGAT